MVAFEKMFCSETSKDSHPQGPPCWRQLLKWLGCGLKEWRIWLQTCQLTKQWLPRKEVVTGGDNFPKRGSAADVTKRAVWGRGGAAGGRGGSN